MSVKKAGNKRIVVLFPAGCRGIFAGLPDLYLSAGT